MTGPHPDVICKEVQDDARVPMTGIIIFSFSRPGVLEPIDTLYYCFLETPIGALLLCADKEHLREIQQPHNGRPRTPKPHWKQKQIAVLRATRAQLREYFDGRRRRFELPLAPDGTPFQQTVWQAMRKVRYARTVSYGELARVIERPNAGRAVGHACGANPLSIIVPCHRIVGSDGSLTGYAGGLKNKQYLLSLEQYVARYAKGRKFIH